MRFHPKEAARLGRLVNELEAEARAIKEYVKDWQEAMWNGNPEYVRLEQLIYENNACDEFTEHIMQRLIPAIARIVEDAQARSDMPEPSEEQREEQQEEPQEEVVVEQLTVEGGDV